MSKNRCFKNFLSVKNFWRPAAKEYWKKLCPSLQKTTFQPCISSGNLRFDAYKFSTFRNLGIYLKLLTSLASCSLLCLTIELLHHTLHKSHSLDSKLVLLLILNAHPQANKWFQNVNNETNKEKFHLKNGVFYQDFQLDINYVDYIFLFD